MKYAKTSLDHKIVNFSMDNMYFLHNIYFKGKIYFKNHIVKFKKNLQKTTLMLD